MITPLSNAPDVRVDEKQAAEAQTSAVAAPTTGPNPGLYHGTLIPASTRLQNMIRDSDHLIVCPGVYDGLSARTALEVGFEALYMVSSNLQGTYTLQ